MSSKKGQYEFHPDQRVSLSEKFASYYGNIRGFMLGANLQGRRANNVQDNPFGEDAQLTAFKKEKETSSGEEGQLKPKSVDFKRTHNRQAHRTSDYEIPNLIIRRGQSFDMSITFDRSFSVQDDTLLLKFVTGRQPLQSKGTVVPVFSQTPLQEGTWGYQLLRIEDKTVHLKVGASNDAIVGRYNLFIETSRIDDKSEVEKCRYAQPDDIYILFNPWCKDDQVFLDDEAQRQEYVLNETGRIWLGTVGKFCVRPWNFAQFDDVCLVAATAIMEKSELGDPARGNAVHVIRALSKVINNNERDGGVLVGNWSGKYDDGVAPNAWNGSTAILEEFLKKRKGVRFGQCWTFAAVATTIFRALGIPTRCVTCFKAAHDSDYSSQMDCHWSIDGKPKTSLDDTVWDYHVWNESWCKRPDLPPGMDGWQAFDATPQECTGGVFTCGPASVNAIRKGEVFYGFDTEFLFAEVNGDRVHWSVDAEGNMKPVAMDTKMMGRFISTKAVGTISRDDLTSNYKHPDGSTEEKGSLELATGLSLRRHVDVVQPEKEDVVFTLNSDLIRNGDLSVTLNIKNISACSRSVYVRIAAIACRYTGIPCLELKEIKDAIVIEPNTATDVSLSLKGADYMNTIDSDSHVNLFVWAAVKDTQQTFVTRQPMWLEKPNIEIKTEGSAYVGRSFEAIIKFANPLSVPLSGGFISIEGPGMHRIPQIKVKKIIGPGEEMRETVQMKPRRKGRKEIIVNFYCKQISDITGVTEVDVLEEPKAV